MKKSIVIGLLLTLIITSCMPAFASENPEIMEPSAIEFNIGKINAEPVDGKFI